MTKANRFLLSVCVCVCASKEVELRSETPLMLRTISCWTRNVPSFIRHQQLPEIWIAGHMFVSLDVEPMFKTPDRRQKNWITFKVSSDTEIVSRRPKWWCLSLIAMYHVVQIKHIPQGGRFETRIYNIPLVNAHKLLITIVLRRYSTKFKDNSIRKTYL